ncbi:hypothetical protein ACMWP9_35540, partial [Escherichia coli]
WMVLVTAAVGEPGGGVTVTVRTEGDPEGGTSGPIVDAFDVPGVRLMKSLTEEAWPAAGGVIVAVTVRLASGWLPVSAT